MNSAACGQNPVPSVTRQSLRSRVLGTADLGHSSPLAISSLSCRYRPSSAKKCQPGPASADATSTTLDLRPGPSHSKTVTADDDAQRRAATGVAGRRDFPRGRGGTHNRGGLEALVGRLAEPSVDRGPLGGSACDSGAKWRCRRFPGPGRWTSSAADAHGRRRVPLRPDCRAAGGIRPAASKGSVRQLATRRVAPGRPRVRRRADTV